ncbi:MAG TPA: uroporphyrinogen-III C-methyltransferase [Burkholderiales bacterium]|nr:uroporphyrinogen-III C-methyltransferase [Burkholderiales bacterium]
MTDNSQLETPSSLVKQEKRFILALLILLAVAALLAWQWFDARDQIAALQQEFAKRLADTASIVNDNRVIVKYNQEQLRETQVKLGLLENKLAESQNLQIALESLYQELSRNSDEWALVEVQQMLDIASQQLQLAGNVKAALIALQTADARLQRIDRPQLIPLRKIINKDIERLKAVPYVDTVAISVQLDNLISKVDSLPLAMDVRRHSAQSEAGERSAQSAWLKFTREIWQDMKQMVRIQNTAEQEIPLLAPDQLFFLRENLKLRLLSARLALLLHDETSFKSDINSVQKWLSRYYDNDSEATKAALASLRQLQARRISIGVPDISASLDAARNFKLAREKAAK